MSKRFPLFEDIPGQVLVTTTCRDRSITQTRRHLVKMDTGEWALVESWMTQGDWQNWERVYYVDNRIGSHPTVEEAQVRFDKWVGPPLSVPAGMPES